MLQRYAPTWLVHLPALLGDGERERLQRQLPGVTPVRMLRELAEALDALTRTIPLVLVLEDLHWSDVSTVNLLTYLAQRRDPPGSCCWGRIARWTWWCRRTRCAGMLQELRGRGVCDELALELLLPDDVEAYMAARLGGEVTAELVALLYHQTEGNALFLVNLLEHLVEQGVVKQEGDQWTLRAPLTRGDQPAGRPAAADHQTAREARPGRAARPGSGQCGGRRVCRRRRWRRGWTSPWTRSTPSVTTLGQQHDFLESAGLDEWPDGTLSGCYRFQHALYRQVLAARLGELPADAGAPPHGGTPGAGLWPADADDRHAAGLPTGRTRSQS